VVGRSIDGMPQLIEASDIDEAAIRLSHVIHHTPLQVSERLAGDLGQPVFLKREDLQVCRSYKARGAYNLIASLDAEQRHRGVVCASAGNHGQGVAFSCRQLQLHGRIFLPTNTPRQKRQRIEAIGGPWVELILVGSSYDQASAAALKDSARTGAVYVHPFDDARTIVGQGTMAIEIAEQHPDPIDTLLVPVGGGGLISGLALWFDKHAPTTRVIGVEPAGAASMQLALRSGGPRDLDSIDSFVDGAAVGRVGELTFPLVRDLVDEVISVPEGAICTEMLELYQTEGIIAEPAGALASAAIRFLSEVPTGDTVCILSGGNNDVSRYGDVVERSLLYEGLRHYFLVTFSQEPGSLRRFLDDVLIEGEDIVAFEYVKKTNRETGPALVGIEVERAEGLPGLLARMADSPLEVETVSPGSPLFSFLL
jgi:threonine dehydratase